MRLIMRRLLTNGEYVCRPHVSLTVTGPPAKAVRMSNLNPSRHRRATRWALLILPVVATSASSCNKKSEPASTTTSLAPTAEAPGSTAPGALGKGVVAGTVKFKGKAPEPKVISTPDPFCARQPIKEEDLLVNASGGLKNVIVRVVKGASGTYDAPKTPASVDQNGCMYRPHVQVVAAGQTVQIRNSDQTLHNVHTYKGASTMFNQAQIPGGGPLSKTFADGGQIVKFKCDVHPWMTGYVAIATNPFFAVTGEDGAFKLENLPAGNYTVEAWHERLGPGPPRSRSKLTPRRPWPRPSSSRRPERRNQPRDSQARPSRPAILNRFGHSALKPPDVAPRSGHRDSGGNLLADLDRRPGPRYGIQPGLPDWPTCYGTMMPVMQGGVAIEHSHRLAAGTVVILTLMLAAVTTGSLQPAHRHLRRPAWLAVGLVFTQALLGGITVLLRLPTLVSTLHTATSLLFFSTVLYVAVRSRPAPAAPPHHPPATDPARAALAVNFALVAAVALFFQMVLGGLVRHSGAALACLDVPLCRGSLWPDAHPTVLVQALHRLGAAVVSAIVLMSSIASFRATANRPRLRLLALAAPLLVGVQIWLGLHAVTSFLDLATVEAHSGASRPPLGLTDWAGTGPWRCAKYRPTPRRWTEAVADLDSPCQTTHQRAW